MVDVAPLTAEQVQELAARLEQRLAELGLEIDDELDDARGERLETSGSEGQDAGEESFADNIAEVGQALLDHHKDERRALRSALARVAEGSYGYCARCGEPIGFARLSAHPAAGRCLSCQERAEAR